MVSSIQWVSYLCGAPPRAMFQCKMSDKTEKQQIGGEKHLNAARATVEEEIAQDHCLL